MNEPRAILASTGLWFLGYAGVVTVIVGCLAAVLFGPLAIVIAGIGVLLIVIAAVARIVELLVDILKQIYALREELAAERGEDPLERAGVTRIMPRAPPIKK